MAECIKEFRVCKGARETLDYAFNLTPAFSARWRPDYPFAIGATVRPTDLGTGLEYVSGGGQSGGGLEPIWPTTVAGTRVDGTITWTAQALSNASLRHRISTVVWDTVAGITLSDQVEIDTPGLQEIQITASGGTVGKRYVCPALITTIDGLEFEVRLVVTIDA